MEIKNMTNLLTFCNFWENTKSHSVLSCLGQLFAFLIWLSLNITQLNLNANHNFGHDFTGLTGTWRNRFHWFNSLKIHKMKCFWSWNVAVFLLRSKRVGSMCTQMPIYFLPKWQNFYSIKSRKGSHFEKEGILTFFCETLNYEYDVVSDLVVIPFPRRSEIQNQ